MVWQIYAYSKWHSLFKNGKKTSQYCGFMAPVFTSIIKTTFSVDTCYHNSWQYISYICPYFYFKFQQLQLLAITKYLLYSHTSGIWDQLLGMVNKNMAYILTQPLRHDFSGKSQGLSGAAHQKKEKKRKTATMIVAERWCHCKFLVNCESCYELDASQRELTCIRTAPISPILPALIVQHGNKHLCRVSVSAAWCKTSGKQCIKPMAFPPTCISRFIYLLQFWGATDKCKTTSLFLSHPPLAS